MLTWIALLIVIYIVHYYWKVSKYPKGPFPWPFVGNALQVEPNNLQESLEKWRLSHGNVFTIWLIDRPLVFLMRYNEIKEAVISNADIFLDRSGEYPETLFMATENGGIIFSSGDSWREQRRVALHILRDFGVGKNVMEEQIHEQLEQFIKAVKERDDKDSMEFREPIQVLVANIINQILYGFSYPHNNCKPLMSYADTVASLFSEMWKSVFMLLAQSFPITKRLPYFGYQAVGRHEEKFKWIIDFVKKDVKNAMENYHEDNAPSCFVHAYYQRIENNPALNMDQLYNVCADLFLAGMETTTTTLRWGVLFLASCPDVQEKLRKEIAKEVGFNRLPSLRDKNNMPFTNACIVELQRRSNIVPTGMIRKTSSDVIIDGKLIPAHTNVMPNVHGCHLDDERFPNPLEFKPDRFLNSDGSLNTDLISQTLPFGYGKRQCAGESLARVELFLCLTTIVQRFKIFPSVGKEIDLIPINGAVVVPRPNYLHVEDVNPVDYV